MRLGQGVDRAGRLDPAAVARTRACLAGYAPRLEAYGPARRLLVATSVLRDAADGRGFLEGVAARLRPAVARARRRGGGRARLPRRYGRAGRPGERAAGAHRHRRRQHRVRRRRRRRRAPDFVRSLDIGVVRLTERFVATIRRQRRSSTGSRASSRAAIADGVPATVRGAARGAVGVAGTYTTLVAHKLGLREYRSELVHGHVLGLADIDAAIAAVRDADQRAARPPAGHPEGSRGRHPRRRAHRPGGLPRLRPRRRARAARPTSSRAPRSPWPRVRSGQPDDRRGSSRRRPRRILLRAGVAELVDAGDLKSLAATAASGFESASGTTRAAHRLEDRVARAYLRLLLDMDGVLGVSWRPLPGAAAAVAKFAVAGLPLRVITSTTARSRGDIGSGLREHGFDFADEDLLTASVLAAKYLRSAHPEARVFLLGDARPEDLEGVRLVGLDDEPQVVLVSGADESFAFDTLNRVYRVLLGGASLVAMHRNLSWMTHEGERLDAGAYLMGLERAAARKAVVTGKPAPGCFVAGLEALGLSADRVGDGRRRYRERCARRASARRHRRAGAHRQVPRRKACRGERHARSRDRLDRRSAGPARPLRPPVVWPGSFTATRRGPTIEDEEESRAFRRTAAGRARAKGDHMGLRHRSASSSSSLSFSSS